MSPHALTPETAAALGAAWLILLCAGFMPSPITLARLGAGLLVRLVKHLLRETVIGWLVDILKWAIALAAALAIASATPVPAAAFASSAAEQSTGARPIRSSGFRSNAFAVMPEFRVSEISGTQGQLPRAGSAWPWVPALALSRSAGMTSGTPAARSVRDRTVRVRTDVRRGPTCGRGRRPS